MTTNMSNVPRETMANLPPDLAEEVLSRLPLTSLKSVRSTCKTWNTISKDSRFTTKHLDRQAKLAAANGEFMLVFTMDYKIHLVSVNHDQNMRDEGTLINLDCTDQIDVCQVFHCNGLLLCISQDNARLVVWNPYWGQSRWIKPTHNFDRLDCHMYALGYDKSSNFHKVLSFVDYTILNHIDCDALPTAVTFADYRIYDFNTHSWTVLDVTVDWILDCDRHVSIKGDTYWFAKSKASRIDEEDDCCLLCFDFTKELFGARLPMPPFVRQTSSTIALSLSSVREEQLVILFQHTLMEIWVTTKIEPNTVLWASKVFLAVGITDFQLPFTHASFFIDEEKQVAVVFGKDKEEWKDPTSDVAYVVGVDGSLIKAHLGDSLYKYCFPRVCSYVPSLVQLN